MNKCITCGSFAVNVDPMCEKCDVCFWEDVAFEYLQNIKDLCQRFDIVIDEPFLEQGKMFRALSRGHKAS